MNSLSRPFGPMAAAAAVAVAVVLLAAGCTSSEEQAERDGSAQPTVATTAPPTSPPLPDCPVQPASRPSEWPLELPERLVITDFIVQGSTFLARGVANDPEGLIIETFDETLADYSVSDPEDDAADLVLVFEGDGSSGSLLMSDDDRDECWDVELAITFTGEPDMIATAESDADATDATDATDGAAEPARPLDGSDLADPVGSGSATTGSGSFQLLITECELSPINVVGLADEGALVAVQAPSGQTELTWTYADGTVVSDADARAIVPPGGSALIVADGENAQGPETIILDVTCDQP